MGSHGAKCVDKMHKDEMQVNQVKQSISYCGGCSLPYKDQYLLPVSVSIL